MVLRKERERAVMCYVDGAMHSYFIIYLLSVITVSVTMLLCSVALHGDGLFLTALLMVPRDVPELLLLFRTLATTPHTAP